MANITESAVWEDSIYQIAETDLVLGGATGTANVQPKQLANRTKWLKQNLGLPYVENKTGSTTECTLAHTPVADAAVQVFVNRLLAIQGEDYTIAGNTITFTPAISADDDLRVVYRGN